MKVCRFKVPTTLGPITQWGLLEGDKIFSPHQYYKAKYYTEGHFNFQQRASFQCPAELSEFLNIVSQPIDFLKEVIESRNTIVEKAANDSNCPQVYFEIGHSAQLIKPIDSIHTYRDFYAHELHVATGFKKRGEIIPEAWYQLPVYYKGATTHFIGPGETILWPHYSKKLDYELELGLVMARDGINIKEKDALNYAFGFTILNDISARDIQKKEMSCRLGPAKAKDFCSIIGPVITTVDEFNYREPELKMTARINGEIWSEGKSNDAHFSFSQMIAHVAMDEWVRSSDLLGSGTVGTGCGLELDKWPNPGDEIELEVEHIGILKNTFGQPSKIN